jgi:hypothetical protein
MHAFSSGPIRVRAAGTALLFALALLPGCSATRITSIWKDPGVVPQPFHKVVGIAMSQDAALRRIAEDAFVRAVGAPTAVAGYSVVPDAEMQDKDQVRARIEASGADGTVVYRVVGVEHQERWVPPTYYGDAWGYWGYAAPMVYEPGYLATDRIVQVETNAYQVQAARLIWAARSETMNPNDAQQTIDEVVKATVEAMRKDGILPVQ